VSGRRDPEKGPVGEAKRLKKHNLNKKKLNTKKGGGGGGGTQMGGRKREFRDDGRRTKETAGGKRSAKKTLVTRKRSWRTCLMILAQNFNWLEIASAELTKKWEEENDEEVGSGGENQNRVREADSRSYVDGRIYTSIKARAEKSGHVLSRGATGARRGLLIGRRRRGGGSKKRWGKLRGRCQR